MSLNCQENIKAMTDTASNIISIDIIINIKLFLLNIKPRAPNPNKIKAKFTIRSYIFISQLIKINLKP